jgi:hypothetical protein
VGTFVDEKESRVEGSLERLEEVETPLTGVTAETPVEKVWLEDWGFSDAFCVWLSLVLVVSRMTADVAFMGIVVPGDVVSEVLAWIPLEVDSGGEEGGVFAEKEVCPEVIFSEAFALAL